MCSNAPYRARNPGSSPHPGRHSSFLPFETGRPWNVGCDCLGTHRALSFSPSHSAVRGMLCAWAAHGDWSDDDENEDEPDHSVVWPGAGLAMRAQRDNPLY
ncbi:hypothetical protein PsYK624_052860 [Phanerochaete sordida]|uniref:Uncharacterized protein n=1 Tax=Phanerochaete sordida TaxID=48140 RepID=A0A9P3G6M6_9APHY|nr:hypothetical protein PsYK624_052860 [Phanerochaete sordida]